jgi:uncharacterized membrane protein
MDTRALRLKVGGAGAVVLGIAAALYPLITDGSMLFLILGGIVAVGGVSILANRSRVYYYLLPAIGVVSLVIAVQYYLAEGSIILAAVLTTLGVVTLVRGVQAYRVLLNQSNRVPS